VVQLEQVRDEKAKVVTQLERNGKESEAIKARLEERLKKADALERELHEKVKAAFDAEKAAMAEKERVQERIDTLTAEVEALVRARVGP
jgi:chromosome segregation ATPase